MKPHPIDFTELQEHETSKGSGLENMVCRILSSMGLEVIYSGVGADGGCDILATGTIKNSHNDKQGNWLIECKDKSISKRAVSTTEVGIIDNCFAHKCDSYLLVTTTQPSSGLVTKMNRITNNEELNIVAAYWNREKLIEILYKEEFEDILKEYLPNSYRNVKELDKPRIFKSGKLRWRDTFDEIVDLLEFSITPSKEEKEKAYNLAFEQIENSELDVVDAVLDTMNDSQFLEEMAILLMMMASYSKNSHRRVFAISNLRYYELLDLKEVIPYLESLSENFQRLFFEQEGIEELVGDMIDDYFKNGPGYNTICDIGNFVYLEEVHVISINPCLEKNKINVSGEFSVSLKMDHSTVSDVPPDYNETFYDSKTGTYKAIFDSYENIKIESISLPFGEPEGF